MLNADVEASFGLAGDKQVFSPPAADLIFAILRSALLAIIKRKHTNSECVVACCPKQTHAVERRVVLQFMLRFSRLIARLSFPAFDDKTNILLDDVVDWKKKDSYAVALKNFAYNELRTAPCAHAQMIGRRNVESENSFTSQWRQLSTVTAPTILLQFPVDATVLTMEPQNKLVE